MRNFMKSKPGVAVMLIVGVFVWTHFSRKIQDYRKLGDIIHSQNAEMARLNASVEKIQTMKSLAVDLRVKLSGGQSSPLSVAAISSGIPSRAVFDAARSAHVEFSTLDRIPTGVAIRFGGNYPDIKRFLSLVETQFQRVEQFSLEKHKDAVSLSLQIAEK